MPWNEKNYPNSWKNLDAITRRKAIDIANAMIADGYDDEKAIPIATAKAKEWAQDANKSDKSDLKRKDITKHKGDGSGAKYQDADVEVIYRPEDKKWEVKSKGAEKADSLHDTKVDAEKRAKSIAQYRKGKVISHEKNNNKSS